MQSAGSRLIRTQAIGILAAARILCRRNGVGTESYETQGMAIANRTKYFLLPDKPNFIKN
jgi:hypothetical protein